MVQHITAENVLHSFSGSDGKSPEEALLLPHNGLLFGTTHFGGANGEGTVFRISSTGVFKALYSFGPEGGGDGSAPLAGLKYLDGVFYGTTEFGGAVGNGGNGTVYGITPSGTATALHSFAVTDGKNPNGNLLALNGVLYGVTNSGGKYGYGAIFKITTTGPFSELHNFKGTDGANPAAALTALNGVLYGTTSAGGAHGDGVVFTLKL